MLERYRQNYDGGERIEIDINELQNNETGIGRFDLLS